MLANELKSAGIRVNSVTPGYTATNLNQHKGVKTPKEGAAAIVKYVTTDNARPPESFLIMTAKYPGKRVHLTRKSMPGLLL